MTDRVSRCLRLQADDNVAVALGDAVPGLVSVVGADDMTIMVSEPIRDGHKIALRDIRAGDAVLKYGVVIGFATEPILAGAWVHTHNCRSGLDERSHTLDRHTGAPTDTEYV
jgi:altronate dehydratase small subunit